LKPGDRRKLVRKRQVGEGKVRHRNKDERKKLLRREAEVQILNPNDGACKKLWRDKGKLRYSCHTQVGAQGSQTGYTLASSSELTRMSVQVGSSCEDNTTWHFLPGCMLAQL